MANSCFEITSVITNEKGLYQIKPFIATILIRSDGVTLTDSEIKRIQDFNKKNVSKLLGLEQFDYRYHPSKDNMGLMIKNFY